MERLILLGVLLGAVISVTCDIDIGRGYHEEIGIPLAESIKAQEDAINVQDERIVGGAVASWNAHPYLGGLIISFWNIAGNSACGSSLLSHNRLVTAAHCWFDGVNHARQFIVVLGSNMLFSGGIRIATSSVLMHPQWTPSLLANDVAMIFLPTSVQFSNWSPLATVDVHRRIPGMIGVVASASIQPISLPNPWELSETFAGQWAIAAGYGRTSDQQVGISVNAVISEVNLQVITEQACRAVFTTWILPSTLCTSGIGGVGVCGGDSGGPLLIRRNGQNVLIGISSFVDRNGCQRGNPSAFARVTSFYNFITQYL